jgi:hypothetical protein
MNKQLYREMYRDIRVFYGARGDQLRHKTAYCRNMWDKLSRLRKQTDIPILRSDTSERLFLYVFSRYPEYRFLVESDIRRLTQ